MADGDDRAIEDLRKAMEKLVVERYKSNEGACRGSLTPSKVAQIMGAPTASLEDVKGTEVLYSGIGIPVDQYFITVKNIDNGEECVHGKGVHELGGWHKLFLDQPIFRNLNVVQEPRFPDLIAPSQNTELWTHTYMKKSGANFLVIVTLAFDWIFRGDYLKTDTVIVHVKSPLLPQTCSLYHSMKSSRSRKMCSLHYAFAELAKEYGFAVNEQSIHLSKMENDWSTSIFHSEAAVDESSWSHFTLIGAFPSNAVEYSAGSVTIPLTLQKLRFLLFSLDDQAPMHYAIVQPHKYGYAFQIPNLSWWRVMATVNIYGEWLGIEKTFREKNLSLLEPIRIPSSQGIGSQGALFDVVDIKMLEDTFKKIDACYARTHEEFKTILNTAPPEVKALFQDSTGKVDITYRKRSTQDLEKLNPAAWRLHLKFLGLDLMRNSLVQKVSWFDHKLDVSKGNALLSSLLDSYTNPGVLSKEIPSRAFLVDIIDIWFRLCEVFAITFFDSGLANSQIDLRNKIVNARKDFTPVSFTFEKLISFCRDLMDSNPSSWVSKFYPALKIKPFPFILSIIDYHSFYAVFFPEKRWGDPAKLWDMIQHAFVYNQKVVNAKKHAQTVTQNYKGNHTEEVLASAFAYLLFTFDKNRDLDYWGMDPAKNPKNAPAGENDPQVKATLEVVESIRHLGGNLAEILHTSNPSGQEAKKPQTKAASSKPRGKKAASASAAAAAGAGKNADTASDPDKGQNSDGDSEADSDADSDSEAAEKTKRLKGGRGKNKGQKSDGDSDAVAGSGADSDTEADGKAKGSKKGGGKTGASKGGGGRSKGGAKGGGGGKKGGGGGKKNNSDEEDGDIDRSSENGDVSDGYIEEYLEGGASAKKSVEETLVDAKKAAIRDLKNTHDEEVFKKSYTRLPAAVRKAVEELRIALKNHPGRMKAYREEYPALEGKDDEIAKEAAMKYLKKASVGNESKAAS